MAVFFVLPPSRGAFLVSRHWSAQLRSSASSSASSAFPLRSPSLNNPLNKPPQARVQLTATRCWPQRDFWRGAPLQSLQLVDSLKATLNSSRAAKVTVTARPHCWRPPKTPQLCSIGDLVGLKRLVEHALEVGQPERLFPQPPLIVDFAVIASLDDRHYDNDLRLTASPTLPSSPSSSQLLSRTASNHSRSWIVARVLRLPAPR